MKPRHGGRRGAAVGLWLALGALAVPGASATRRAAPEPPLPLGAASLAAQPLDLGPPSQSADPLGQSQQQPVPQQVPLSGMPGQTPPQLKSKGMLSMRSLRIASAGEEGSKIFLGQEGEVSLGTDASGSFAVRQASKPLLALDSQNTLHLGARQVEALTVNAVGGLSLRGVQQWQLVKAEDFTASGDGWSRGQVSQCAGVFMLGGYCRLSRGEVNKTFAGLPPHKQLRVVATFHFIDRWIGEAGYMKLNIGPAGQQVVVWSEQHSEQLSRNGISLCGRSTTPEGKFAAPIDVTVPHQQDAVVLAFGSTMEDSDPCDESWGVSGLEIYTRN